MDGTETVRAGVRQSTPTGTPGGTPTGTSAESTPGVVGSEWIVDALPIAWGFQDRVAVSVGLLVFVLVSSWLLVPWTIGRAQRASQARLPADRSDRWLRHVDERMPFALTTYYLVRVIQGSLVAASGLVLLAVWGRTEWALWAVDGFLANVPRLIQLVLSVALLVSAYVAVGLLEDFVDRIARRSGRFDEHQGEIVFRVLQVVLLATAGLVVLMVWDVNPGGLLVGAGFLGIVVGMAARQTLGQLLAGFVLMFSRPFAVGDWVEVDGREGIVTDITIVNTRLENFDGEYVVMPNDVVSNSTIVNRTRKGRLRVRLEVGVDYGVDPEHAEAVAKDAITDLDEVMSVPRPQVVPTRFGDSAIVVELRFWIDKPSSRRRWRARAAALRAVYAAFAEEEITIPYPQRELSARNESRGVMLSRESEKRDAPSKPAED